MHTQQQSLHFNSATTLNWNWILVLLFVVDGSPLKYQNSIEHEMGDNRPDEEPIVGDKVDETLELKGKCKLCQCWVFHHCKASYFGRSRC